MWIELRRSLATSGDQSRIAASRHNMNLFARKLLCFNPRQDFANQSAIANTAPESIASIVDLPIARRGSFKESSGKSAVR